MTVLRSLVFQLLFWTWTTLLAFLYLPMLVLPRQAIVVAGRAWAQSVLWLLGRVVGLRHRIEGRENVPGEPAIWALKHQSAWDTLIVPILVPDPVVILKRELLWLPFYGWYARKHGMVGIDRAGAAAALRGMVAAARKAAAAGHSIVVFPEGTRTAPGRRRPYHSGIAALYGQLALPVVPVALNSGLFWGRRAFTRKPGTITLRILPPIPSGLDRRAFMARLEEAIETATDRLVDTAQSSEKPGNRT
jgi:1-acyl-sn-glycerol-3-phosphate acyltransferase